MAGNVLTGRAARPLKDADVVTFAYWLAYCRFTDSFVSCGCRSGQCWEIVPKIQSQSVVRGRKCIVDKLTPCHKVPSHAVLIVVPGIPYSSCTYACHCYQNRPLSTIDKTLLTYVGTHQLNFPLCQTTFRKFAFFFFHSLFASS
jgi:hypothetical protein